MKPRGNFALVNLNFTFGVLNGARDSWLTSVKEACELAEIRCVVSAHPAERSRTENVEFSTTPFRHAILGANVLISRFSTVPFEAIARGRPFIYHNPHHETVPTFTLPEGAFPITTSTEELRSALERITNDSRDYRAIAENFFRNQVDIDEEIPSERRAAEFIFKIMHADR